LTTRWVIVRATGSTTTRLTCPQGPSVQLASAPIVNGVASAMAILLASWTLARTRPELRATGETSRPRTPEAWDQLTPQELQIAQLAAEGLSNREIGQMLYLSPRTVGSHLYRAYPKLGITSRAQLREQLERRTPGGA
jgi:DNA-binding CsgD family transcriptional regulator